jgi:hypothetical protein
MNGKANQSAAEANSLFVVTFNGRAAHSEVVVGLEGVREAILQGIWRDQREAISDELVRQLDSLEDAAVWAAHGDGDGRPFWHFWVGFADGSVAVQRLTMPLPVEQIPSGERQVLREALSSCADELRGMGREFTPKAWLISSESKLT